MTTLKFKVWNDDSLLTELSGTKVKKMRERDSESRDRERDKDRKAKKWKEKDKERMNVWFCINVSSF